MLKDGRQPDNEFSPDEKLFRRIEPTGFDFKKRRNRRISLDQIPLPDMSVNRSKHGGRIEHVLLGGNYSHCGVISFKVEDIPPAIENLATSLYIPTGLQHNPLHENYFHTLIRAYDAYGRPIDTAMKFADIAHDPAYRNWRDRIRQRAHLERQIP